MSNPWKILGVPRGSDRAAIRRAYAAKLKVTNPEDDPDAFKRLREAYEWATQMVDQEWAAAQAEAEAEALQVAAADPSSSEDEPGQAHAAEDEANPPVDREAQELNSLLGELADSLGGPWRDDRRAVSQLRAILAHPGLNSIDYRAQAEFAIARMIADFVPSSDGILMEAIQAFEWDRLGRGVHWPFSAALARFEEWKLISAFGQPNHPLHDAWALLGNHRASKYTNGVRSMTKTARNVQELIALIDYQLPGLAHSLAPQQIEWWRNRLARPVFDIVAYLTALGAAVVVGAVAGHATDSIRVGLGFGLFVALITGFELYGRDGGYNAILPPPYLRNPRQRRLGRWIAYWPWMFAVVPLLALAVPAAWWGATAVLLVATAAFLSLSLSGEAQPISIDQYWSPLLICGLLMLLLPTLMLAPPASRLLALLALGLLASRPFISASTAIVEKLDEAGRGQGGLIAALYGAAIVAIGWNAAEFPQLSDPVMAPAVVGMTLWSITPIVAAARQSIVAFLARGIRMIAIFIFFMTIGLGEPISVGPGMSNGQALVAWKMGVRDGLPDQFGERMEQMKRENAALYTKLMDAARDISPDVRDENTIQDAVQSADAIFNDAAPALLPVTSYELAARYQQAKVVLLESELKVAASRCASGELIADDRVDAESRRVIGDAILAIAAAGHKRVAPADVANLPTLTELQQIAANQALLVDQLKSEVGAQSTDIAKCRSRIADARALAAQPPRAIAAVYALKGLRR